MIVFSKISEAYNNGHTYEAYRKLIADLLEQGKTTGPDQSESMIQYTKLNDQRMNRIDKTVSLSGDIQSRLDGVKSPEQWLVITEAWCGDAAQIIPCLHAMESATDKISMRMILRHENPEIMNEFLTNGSQSIPILIRLDTANERVIGSWGPRPKVFQDMVEDWKVKKDIPKDELYTKMHAAYGKDRGAATMGEVLGVVGV